MALHKVAFESTGEKKLDVAKKLVDPSLFLRQNTISNASDAIAMMFNTIWHVGLM